MALKIKELEKFVVVYLHGRVDIEFASILQDELDALVGKYPEHSFLLNMAEVDYLSSSGLQVFVSVMRRLMETGRSLRLSGLPGSIKRVFEVVEILEMFDIYDSEAEALTAS